MALLWLRILEDVGGFCAVMRSGRQRTGWALARLAFEHWLTLHRLAECEDDEARERIVLLLRQQDVGFQAQVWRLKDEYAVLHAYQSPTHADDGSRLDAELQELRRATGLRQTIGLREILGVDPRDYCAERGLLDQWFILYKVAHKFVHADVRQSISAFRISPDGAVALRPPDRRLEVQLGLRLHWIMEQSASLMRGCFEDLGAEAAVWDSFAQMERWMAERRDRGEKDGPAPS